MHPIRDEIQAYRPLITNFAQREMKARYKRSILGWLWSLINPASVVLTYSLVFGVFLRSQPPDTANGKADVFALYLFTGLIVWSLFSQIVSGSMDWLASVQDLRKKVYFPTETAIMGAAVATGVQTLFEVAILFAIMAVLTNVSWTFLLFPLVLLGVASFAIGIGFVVAILNTRYRDVRHLVGILMSLGFFMVPIIYPMSLLEDPDIDTYGLPAREIVSWNPVSQFVGAAHDLIYFLQLPSPGRVIALLIYSTVVPLLGLRFFRARSMAISEEL